MNFGLNSPALVRRTPLTILLNDVDVIDNYSFKDGAVRNVAGSLVMTGCRLRRNGVAAGPGAVLTLGGVTLIQDTIIEGITPGVASMPAYPKYLGSISLNSNETFGFYCEEGHCFYVANKK